MTAVNLIDEIAYAGTLPAVLAKVKTPEGFQAVVYNPNTSALIALHTAGQAQGRGLEAHQLNAGLRFENDHLAGQMGSSNAAAIMRHLEKSLPATPADQRAKAFGHVMRSAGDSKGHVDLAAIRLDAAHRKGWVFKRMSKVSWVMLDLFILHDMSVKAIAQRLDLNHNYAGGRVREALSELAKVYEDYDACGGRDSEHPTYGKK